MEIAISKYCNGLLVAKSESYGRLATDSKALALTASVCLEIYPFDVMLLKHRIKG